MCKQCRQSVFFELSPTDTVIKSKKIPLSVKVIV